MILPLKRLMANIEDISWEKVDSLKLYVKMGLVSTSFAVIWATEDPTVVSGKREEEGILCEIFI